MATSIDRKKIAEITRKLENGDISDEQYHEQIQALTDQVIEADRKETAQKAAKAERDKLLHRNYELANDILRARGVIKKDEAADETTAAENPKLGALATKLNLRFQKDEAKFFGTEAQYTKMLNDELDQIEKDLGLAVTSVSAGAPAGSDPAGPAEANAASQAQTAERRSAPEDGSIVKEGGDETAGQAELGEDATEGEKALHQLGRGEYPGIAGMAAIEEDLDIDPAPIEKWASEVEKGRDEEAQQAEEYY